MIKAFLFPLLLAFAQQTPADTGAIPFAPRDSALEAQVRAVAAKLRCPVCQGLSLADTPSPLGIEMRGVIREQLRAGRTPDEVKAYFISKYNEWILLQPKAEGFNLAVYVLPIVFLLGGGVLVFVLARRWSRNAGPQVVSGVDD